MKIFHLCIAFDTPEEIDFIDFLQKATHKRGMSTYVVSHYNLDETIDNVYGGHLGFLSYYDRASDTTPAFLSLYKLLKEQRTLIFQNIEKQCRAADKAVMHYQFEKEQIPVPRTMVAAKNPINDFFDITEEDLRQFKKPFVIKPAVNTGASLGVNTNAYSLKDVSRAWHDHPDEKYLIQEKICEKRKDGRKFWFRVFHICDETKICWWDPDTFCYKLPAPEEISKFNLDKMYFLTKKIADLCQLKFFSTEFAMDESGNFFAIDYVNEICDMRIQSKHVDGVPDDLVRSISDIIIDHLAKCI